MSKLEKKILKRVENIIGELPPYATAGDKAAAINRRYRFGEDEIKEIIKKLKT